VWVKWSTVESYKLFNRKESEISKVKPRKIQRQQLKNLARKGVRTSIIASSHKVVTQYSSEVLEKALINSTAYRYIENMHSYQSKNSVIDVVELYPSYKASITDMRD